MRFKILVLLFIFLFSHLSYSQVNVKGYFRKDGTYVQPHVRTSPNRTKLDNWSTRGNTNPYTGKEGTKDVYDAGNIGKVSSVQNSSSYKISAQNRIAKNNEPEQKRSISDLIEFFNADERTHKILLNAGYEYDEGQDLWYQNKDIIYFKRYPNGGKQLIYEFFDKNILEDLKVQIKTSGYQKLSAEIEGHEVYLNDGNVIGFHSYMMDYHDMEVRRYVCWVENTDKSVKDINDIADDSYSEGKFIHYKGISFESKNEWSVDTLIVDNRLNITCIGGSFSFNVEAMPIGMNNIDSTGVKGMLSKLIENTKRKGASITTDKYKGYFAGFAGFAFDFNILFDSQNFAGRTFIFSDKGFVVIINLMAADSIILNSISKKIGNSFKISSGVQ